MSGSGFDVMRWTRDWPLRGLLAWSLVLSVYVGLSLISGVHLGGASSVAIYYFGAVIGLGGVIARLFFRRTSEVLLASLPLGLITNVIVYWIAVSVGSSKILLPILTLVALVSMRLLRRAPSIAHDLGVADVLALLVGCTALGCYQWSISRSAAVLPASPGDPAFVWLDHTYFLGHVAALKRSPIFPADFHIYGSRLRYHFLYFLLVAIPSDLFSIEALDLLAHATPLFGCFTLVSGTYLIVWRLTGRRINAILACALAIFSAYPGFESSFHPGWSLIINYFSSPTNILGFSIAPIVILLSMESGVDLSGRVAKRLLTVLFWFVLVGSKLSVAAVLLAGVVTFEAISAFLGNGGRTAKTRVADCMLGAAAGYIFFFMRIDTGGGHVPRLVET